MENAEQRRDFRAASHGGRWSEHCADPREIMDSIASLKSCRRGQELCGLNDSGQHWYRIVSGLARAYVLRADGRRQIIDFLQPGDFFGLTSLASVDITAEAVVEGTVVARYPRERLEFLADSDPGLGRRIREIAFEAIARLQRRLLTLGPMTASEKVG
jgi:CRP-like cAMP-binding protein